MKLILYAFSFFLIVYSTAFAGDTIELPAGSRIFQREEDCFAVMKIRYSWTIDLAERLRDMEKSGIFIKYPQKVPVSIIETKTYKMHNYYRISIYNSENKQYGTAWTDANKLE